MIEASIDQSYETYFQVAEVEELPGTEDCILTGKTKKIPYNTNSKELHDNLEMARKIYNAIEPMIKYAPNYTRRYNSQVTEEEYKRGWKDLDSYRCAHRMPRTGVDIREWIQGISDRGSACCEEFAALAKEYCYTTFPDLEFKRAVIQKTVVNILGTPGNEVLLDIWGQECIPFKEIENHHYVHIRDDKNNRDSESFICSPIVRKMEKNDLIKPRVERTWVSVTVTEHGFTFDKDVSALISDAEIWPSDRNRDLNHNNPLLEQTPPSSV